MECRVEQNIERILALLADARRDGDVLHARLDRRALSATGAPASPAPATSSRATASATSAQASRREASSSPTSGLRRRSSKTSRDARSSGYRAPSFSIGASNLWAFDAIAEAGYRYSSSIYPIRHDHYGMPDAPRFAHEVRAGPARNARRDRAAASAATGRPAAAGISGCCPIALSRWSIRRINACDGQPAMFYFHPWELDPEQPRVAGAPRKSALSPLPQPAQDGAAADAPRRAISAGSRADRVFLAGAA